MRIVFRSAVIVIALYSLATAYRCYERKLYIWLPGYAQNQPVNEIARTKPAHLFFMYQDFWAFSKAGRELAKWYLRYETVEPYPVKQFFEALGLQPTED